MTKLTEYPGSEILQCIYRWKHHQNSITHQSHSKDMYIYHPNLYLQILSENIA